MIYVAHPIDGVQHGTAATLIEKWANDLRAAERPAMYWPARAFLNPHHSSDSPSVIGRVNEAARIVCEGLIAILPYGSVTLGVPVEIEKTLQERKPVAIVTDLNGHRSVQIHTWAEQGAYIAADLGPAVKWLQKQIDVRIRNHNRATITLPDSYNRYLDSVFRRNPPVAHDNDCGDSGRNPSVARQVIRWSGKTENRPKRAYSGDAGFDLVCTKQTIVPTSGFVDVPCEVAVEWPPGYWGWLVGRSSTLRNKRLLVNQGIIDNGYRGELFIGVWNLDGTPVTIAPGERIAQLIPMPLTANDLTIDDQPTEELSSSDRGTNGFGSTG